jgi:PhnB protein
MRVEPYLFFNGRCDEAIEFYKRTLNAQVVMVMRFKDSPEPPKPGTIPPGHENKVMHAGFKIGETLVMASDGHSAAAPNFQGFALSINVSTEVEADKVFAALAKGGSVMMPLAKTFFSPKFGMLTDKVGVNWWIIVGE